MNLKNKLAFSGIYAYPLSLSAMYILVHNTAGSGRKLTLLGHLLIWAIALIPTTIILFRNTWDYVFHHKRQFSLGIHDELDSDPTSMSSEKMQALYPKVPKQYLSKVPDGFILGTTGSGICKRYVRFKLDPHDIMMAIICGSPGLGKTASIFLSSLVANFSRPKDQQMVVYCQDVKPEIAVRCVEINGNPNVRIMNPTDRNSWGYDVYYEIHDKEDRGEPITEDFIVKVLNKIARSLITGSEKDAFFVTNAIRAFTGMMLYYYNKGYSFIDGVSEVIERPMDAHIKTILKDPKSSEKVRSLLTVFDGKDSDAAVDIELSLQTELAIFLDADVRWHLRDNPKKARPTDLNRGVSLFNCFKESLLDDASYPSLFRLIVNQICQAMQDRSPESQPCALILDECARVGKLPSLPNLLATGRSRRVSVWIAVQDFSQLEEIYGKDGARGIINLCRIKVILGCDDNATQKSLGDLCGDYRETKSTINESEKGHKTSSTTEWRRVLQPSDLMSLDEKDELVVFIKGKYMRIKKLYYFKDPILNKRNKEVMKINAKEDSNHEQ